MILKQALVLNSGLIQGSRRLVVVVGGAAESGCLPSGVQEPRTC